MPEQKNTNKKEKTTKTNIPRILLASFLRQGKTAKAIAFYFKVSPRTINRRIAEYDLKGIRRRGPKKRAKQKPAVKKLRRWVPTKQYIDRLNQYYNFHNINYPPTKYINPKTRIASNTKAKPKGQFTSATIYYVALESQLFFLYSIQYRYKEKAVNFDEIYSFFSENAMDMLKLSLQHTDIEIADIVAIHFFTKTNKPEFKGFRIENPTDKEPSAIKES